MPRALDGITRRYMPELSLFSGGPEGLQVPVCTFDGAIRTIEIQDPLVSQIFDAAFPAFKAGEAYYRNADLFGGRYRRYAGSSGTLDAGSYFSVARWNGHDDGSLIREIFAYTDPTATGVVMIDDMSHPDDATFANRKYGTTLEAGEYLLLFVHEPERLISRDGQEMGSSGGRISNLFRVPCRTRQLRLENVVDLRLPTVQAWFFETFSKERWLNIGVPLPPVESFLELLLVMLGQYRGGNLLTQAVGRELRIWGIGGLVYPSARCDCALVFESGNVIDWYGWNLVDYETTRKRTQRVDAAVMTMMGEVEDISHGTDFFGLPIGEIKIHQASEGSRRGTWQVIGLESLNSYNWMRRLSPPQRQLLGLPADADLVARAPDGLIEAEQQLRAKYRALVETSGAQPIALERLRQLLGQLARELARVPGGGRAAINVDAMAEKLGLGPLKNVFAELGVATGVLVEEVKGYVRFENPGALEYFTTIGSSGSESSSIDR